MDVRTLCLGILSRGDASGYEIKQKMEETYSHFFQASFGSIYPALKRLTDEGLVIGATQSQEKRPDKKTYSITPKGRMRLVEDLSEPPQSDRIRSEFLVTMLFSELLPPRFLDQVINGYLDRQRRHLVEIERCLGETEHAGQRFLLEFGRAVHSAIIDQVEGSRHLVEGAAVLARKEQAAGTDADEIPAREGRTA